MRGKKKGMPKGKQLWKEKKTLICKKNKSIFRPKSVIKIKINS